MYTRAATPVSVCTDTDLFINKVRRFYSCEILFFLGFYYIIMTSWMRMKSVTYSLTHSVLFLELLSQKKMNFSIVSDTFPL